MVRRDKYYPPKKGERQFNCPRCGVFASQSWSICHSRRRNCSDLARTEMSTAFCEHCYQFSYWLDDTLIHPEESNIEMHTEDLPDVCKKDYLEARSIFNKSPRGAAALLRLCIEKLLIELGKKGNINNSIKELVKEGLPERVQKSLDICRVVGNHAVHPGKMDIEDDPNVAHMLFKLVNFIVEDRITREKEINEIYSSLPERDLEQIEKRDGKNHT